MLSVDTPKLTYRLGAEALGTFLLVFGGCGAAVMAATVPSGDGKFNMGIAYVGVALAFGLTVLTMAYAVGHISGGHFNPAVTIGLAVAKRFAWKDALPYIVTQVVAGTAAATVLFVIANGKAGFSAHDSGFASNGYGDRSPDGYNLLLGAVDRDRAHGDLRVRHPGRHRRPRAGRFRPHRHRPRPHPHPPRLHPGRQHVRQPRPLHRGRLLRRRTRRWPSSGCSGSPRSSAH